MKKFCSFIVFFALFLQAPFLAKADRAFIENTCKATDLYKLCVSTLLADHKSLNADLGGLATIMIYKVRAKGNEALRQIKPLIRTRPDLKKALVACQSKYTTIVESDVPLALRGLGTKFGEDGMADAEVEAQFCEQDLSRRGKSPITGINQDAHNFAHIARAIIRQFL